MKPPADWDEEEYGPFEAPLIPNPRCEEVSGCGVWEKPMVKNPKYKGVYQYRTIPNPAYRGPWMPRFIPNPAFYEEKAPHNLPAIGGVAIEIWTLQEGIAFDNILITHDEACAEVGRPWVYGSIGAFHGQVSLFNGRTGRRYTELYPDREALCALPRSTAGVLGTVPGVIGAIEASEAIKWIAGFGEPLEGKLFTIDLKTLQTETIEF